jgi:hypothetical protein
LGLLRRPYRGWSRDIACATTTLLVWLLEGIADVWGERKNKRKNKGEIFVQIVMSDTAESALLKSSFVFILFSK